MKRVGVAELKAGLSRYLRAVRRGGEIVVCDRDHPIARLVPYQSGVAAEPLPMTEAKGSLKDWQPKNTLRIPEDIVELLLEDRARR